MTEPFNPPRIAKPMAATTANVKPPTIKTPPVDTRPPALLASYSRGRVRVSLREDIAKQFGYNNIGMQQEDKDTWRVFIDPKTNRRFSSGDRTGYKKVDCFISGDLPTFGASDAEVIPGSDNDHLFVKCPSEWQKPLHMRRPRVPVQKTIDRLQHSTSFNAVDFCQDLLEQIAKAKAFGFELTPTADGEWEFTARIVRKK